MENTFVKSFQVQDIYIISFVIIISSYSLIKLSQTLNLKVNYFIFL